MRRTPEGRTCEHFFTNSELRSARGASVRPHFERNSSVSGVQLLVVVVVVGRAGLVFGFPGTTRVQDWPPTEVCIEQQQCRSLEGARGSAEAERGAAEGRGEEETSDLDPE